MAAGGMWFYYFLDLSEIIVFASYLPVTSTLPVTLASGPLPLDCSIMSPPQHFQLPNFAPTGPDIARWVTWVMLGEIFRSDFYFLIFTIHFQHFSYVKYAHDGENISINSDSIRRAKSDSFSNSTLENFQTWNKHERQPKLHENSSSEPQNSKQKPAENPISIMFHSENDKIFMFYHACAKSKNAYPSIMNHTFWTATW